jgi:hypothetical protein
MAKSEEREAELLAGTCADVAIAIKPAFSALGERFPDAIGRGARVIIRKLIPTRTPNPFAIVGNGMELLRHVTGKTPDEAETISAEFRESVGRLIDAASEALQPFFSAHRPHGIGRAEAFVMPNATLLLHALGVEDVPSLARVRRAWLLDAKRFLPAIDAQPHARIVRFHATPPKMKQASPVIISIGGLSELRISAHEKAELVNALGPARPELALDLDAADALDGGPGTVSIIRIERGGDAHFITPIRFLLDGTPCENNGRPEFLVKTRR